MRFADAVALAFRSAGRRLGRAALTVMAVALAATLLVALLTIARTAETRVLGELAKGGPLAGIRVAAAEPEPGQLDRDNPDAGDPKDLDEAALESIRGLPGVRRVIGVVANRMLLVPPAEPSGRDDQRPFQENVVGVDLAQARNLPITVVTGRLPLAGSLTEVAVTEGYLERIGVGRERGAEVLGTTLVLGAARTVPWAPNLRGRWTKGTIVGVVAQEAANGDVLTSLEQAQKAREWSARSIAIGDFEPPTSPYSGLFVVADGLDQVGPVRAAITEIGYSTSAPENLIETVRRYLRVVEIVLAGIGLIALAIAAMGITNAMLAAVRERRREIGVLKAIGARDRDVLRVFLVEAGLLGLLGGLLGTAAGWAIARTVGEVVNRYLAEQGLAGVAVGVPLSIVVGGVVGSTVLALLAGIVPARRAAHLPAREAVDAV